METSTAEALITEGTIPAPFIQHAGNDPESFVTEISSSRVKGEIIGKIACGFWCAGVNTPIGMIASLFAAREDIPAIACVGADNTALGIVIRTELFDMLAQPFGRELFSNKPVSHLIRNVPGFRFNKSIHSVSDAIKEDMLSRTPRYFLLQTDDGRFAGYFSTREMLLYLSEITTKEINHAIKIQQSIMIEKREISDNYFEASCAIRMAKGIGGDYYHASEYRPGQWVFSICDAAGKGISASLVSTVISGMFSIYDFATGMRKFIRSLNNYLISTFENNTFVTSLIIDFNAETGVVKMYDAGHSLAYVFRNGTLHHIRGKNRNSIPLGIQTDICPAPLSFRLKPGDILIMISDGIIEQTNDTDKQFDITGVRRVISRNADADLNVIREALFSGIDLFRNRFPQHDDMTVIMLRYKGNLSAE